MAKDNYTAERELLKTIETGKPQSNKARAGMAPADQMALLKSHAEAFVAKFGRGDAIDLRAVNKAMIVVAALLLVWGGVDVARGMGKLKNIPYFEIPKLTTKATEQAVEFPLLKEFVIYMDTILGRNVFEPVSQQKQTQATPAALLSELFATYRVAGISYSENPAESYAMIENTKEGVTYFIREKERYSGFTITRIDEDCVIVEYDGEEMELR
ncbi:MAG: hypothetical protein ABH885_01800 [Candidatus Omnitrophota bacterium]